MASEVFFLVRSHLRDLVLYFHDQMVTGDVLFTNFLLVPNFRIIVHNTKEMS